MSTLGRRQAGKRSTASRGSSRGRSPGAPLKAPATQAAAPAFAVPGVQRKLAVGSSDSAYEREADQVADSVMRGAEVPAISNVPASGLGAAAQRKTAGEDETKVEETDEVQAKDDTNNETEKNEESVQTKSEEAEEEEDVQAQTEDEEEEEAIQAQAEDEEEEEEAVQSKADDGEDTLQAKPEEEEEEVQAKQEEQQEEEEDVVQSKAGATRARDPTSVQHAVRNPGPGRTLPESVRGRIEKSTGADLSDVRVHDDSEAGRAARDIGARAFTHSRDIWLGAGESARDTRLMAHEATHVIQQTGRQGTPGRATSAGPPPAAAQSGPTTGGPGLEAPAPAPHAGPAVVQRAGGSGGGPPPATPPTPTGGGNGTPGHGSFSGGGGTLNVPASGGATLDIDKIAMPGFANKDTVNPPFEAKRTEGRANAQLEDWLGNVSTPASTVGTKLANVTPPNIAGQDANNPVYFLERKGRSDKPVVGTKDEIGTNAAYPNWDSEGRNVDSWKVDHIHELQIGGADRDSDNLQLLDRVANDRSSKIIKNEVEKRIGRSMNAVKTANPSPPAGSNLEEVFQVARGGTEQAVGRSVKASPKVEPIIFKSKSAQASAEFATPGNIKLWSKPNIETGAHLDALEPITDINRINQLLGGNGPDLTIFFSGRGANPISARIVNGQPQISLAQFGGLGGRRGVAPTSSVTPRYDQSTQILAGLDFQLFGAGTGLPFDPATISVDANPIGSSKFAYTIPGNITEQATAAQIRAKAFSPVNIEGASLGPDGIGINGKLQFTAPVIKGISADIRIDQSGVTLSKTFDTGDFTFPKPVKVTESALTVGIGAGRGGVTAEVGGELQFEVERVGKGNLKGKGATNTGFAVEGEFDFDPALFKGADAKITVAYAEDKFTGSGTLKMGDGQIKGIKSAELNVTVEDEKWEATGTVEPKIPGVSQGALAMKFDPNGGFEIAGELTLGADIPRLKSGKLKAKLVKKDEAYKVSASGDAELDIPGVAARLSASYDDGKFQAEATVGYARGIASGQVTVGATNMPTDPETGRVTDGDPGETVTVFGAGSVTIKFTPWLQGTAGLTVKRDGSMEVKGKVELPKSLEVFPEKKLEKELISLGVDIPIFGVAVAGQRIGIFLNISGGLTAKASVGPGELKDVAVEVTYNPEDESSARITGSARFVVPAEAGLRLTVQGALGAGIPIVSARAGLELGAELGIKGEASAAAQVEWTPSTGLSMEADVGVKASPQFTFDVSGFADVTADLLLTEVELYSKRWQLASFKYGSGMEVGAKLTVKVENNEVKPISMNDVELTTPDIDPVALAKGVIKQVT